MKVKMVVLGFPLSNSLYGLCGRKATLSLNIIQFRAQELCESRGGRPGLPVPNSPCGLCRRKATSIELEPPEQREPPPPDRQCSQP